MRTLLLSGLAASALIATGCTSTSKALGLSKSAPNEFNILTKAPLVVPPEYNLRPPAADESSARDNYTQRAARRAILGDVDEAEPSRGEIALMSRAGVGRADQEIRLKIDGQNSVERKSDSFADRILFWQDGQVVNPDGTIAPLDPDLEARRQESVNTATGGGEVEIRKRRSGPKLPGL